MVGYVDQIQYVTWELCHNQIESEGEREEDWISEAIDKKIDIA